MQQALTLSNEWLPIYIVQMNICRPVGEEIQITSNTLHRHWEQEFIVNFIPPQALIWKARVSKIGQVAKDLSEGKDSTIPCSELPQAFIYFLKLVEQLDRLRRRYMTFGAPQGRNGLKNYLCQDEQIDGTLKFFYQHMPANYKGKYADFIYAYGYKTKIMGLLHSLGKKMWQELFFEEDSLKDITWKPQKDWAGREQQWRAMFDAGLVESCVDVGDAVGLLCHYNSLRKLRHTTNHASDEDDYTVESIRHTLSSALADFYRVAGKARN